MTRSSRAPLTVLGLAALGYVGFPVLAVLLGVASWNGVYDDSRLALTLFWMQMLSFAVAVAALAVTVAARLLRRRRARP